MILVRACRIISSHLISMKFLVVLLNTILLSRFCFIYSYKPTLDLKMMCPSLCQLYYGSRTEGMDINIFIKLLLYMSYRPEQDLVFYVLDGLLPSMGKRQLCKSNGGKRFSAALQRNIGLCFFLFYLHWRKGKENINRIKGPQKRVSRALETLGFRPIYVFFQ